MVSGTRHATGAEWKAGSQPFDANLLSRGEGVITIAMIGKVKRMYFREKRSVREIVRLTSLSRDTVRKWLKAPVLEEPRYRRRATPDKLAAYAETIKLALKADALRPRHERRTARALFTQIGREGYAGSYSSLTWIGAKNPATTLSCVAADWSFAWFSLRSLNIAYKLSRTLSLAACDCATVARSVDNKRGLSLFAEDSAGQTL